MPSLKVSGLAWQGGGERGGRWVDFSDTFNYRTGEEPTFLAPRGQRYKANFNPHSVREGTKMYDVGGHLAVCEKHYRGIPTEEGAREQIAKLIEERAMRKYKIVSY